MLYDENVFFVAVFSGILGSLLFHIIVYLSSCLVFFFSNLLQIKKRIYISRIRANALHNVNRIYKNE